MVNPAQPAAGGPTEGMRVMQEKSVFVGGLSLQALQHRRRCAKLPALRNGEAEDLVAAFLAAKSITVCPTRYVVPIEQRPFLGRASN